MPVSVSFVPPSALAIVKPAYALIRAMTALWVVSDPRNVTVKFGCESMPSTSCNPAVMFAYVSAAVELTVAAVPVNVTTVALPPSIETSRCAPVTSA